ncbi:ribokinase [Cellulomonas denverensis]|uniref:ribokinase n=1 Tax=Cellulomonas denverensis TaxID=264297 RepID=UPI001942C895|nr:ribokinase [Cellulomonas denverensis]GIG25105.1 ribokinase [Cellulomonas denverensis]
MTTDDNAPEVVVVGSTNADLLARVRVHPAPGETLLGRSVDVLPGGKGANQAVAAARLGARTAFIGAVGQDTFAPAALSGLRAAGVDLTGLAELPGATGIALVTVADDGENAIVVIPGANGSMDAEAVQRHADLIRSGRVLVLQGEIPRSGAEAAARAAREAGVRLVFNLAPVIEVDPDTLRQADPLVVNEHEAAAALAALDGSGTPAPITGPADEDRVAQSLVEHGLRSVVVTVGARGALVARAGEALTRVPSPRVRAVDTTGAGDAFVGALAHRLARGDDLVTAAHLAARVGAYAVGRAGAQPSYPGATDPLPVVEEQG